MESDVRARRCGTVSSDHRNSLNSNIQAATMPEPSVPNLQTYDFEHVPLNRHVCLMHQDWQSDYEDFALGLFEGTTYQNTGGIGFATVRIIHPDRLEVSWYPNPNDRSHAISLILPREAFVACLHCPALDEKPHIFVKSSWLAAIGLRPYSAFVLIDAIGVKAALLSNQLGGEKLIHLRERIDAIAAANPAIAFVSFADSLLLKTNWFAGRYDNNVTYSYQPESLVRVIPSIAAAFRNALGMEIYAAIAQGVNEYHDLSLLHTSTGGNHISLNSLGLPFAQLLAIDDAARDAIHQCKHRPKELYIDAEFYDSLRFRDGFDKQALPRAQYEARMTSVLRTYVYVDCDELLANLREPNNE